MKINNKSLCVALKHSQRDIKSTLIISLCLYPDAISNKKKHHDVIVAKHLGFGLFKVMVS